MQIDEQPPDNIIGQLLTRTMTGRRGAGGIVRYTMTPELGMTELLSQFMRADVAHQVLVGPIPWADCPHLSPEVCAELLASYPQHERDMRSLGVPMFGTGRVFSVNEDEVTVEPVDLTQRPWWRVIRAIDIGIDHPTAIVWLAHDPEADVVHICRTHRASDTRAAMHAATANAQWPHAPMVVPHDIDNRESGSGRTVRSYYEEAGVRPCIDFANPDGTRYVEPGIFAMQEALATGRLLVWRGLADHFLEECRSYHRDERGRLVKVRDDVISAVRYGYQMIRQHGTPMSDRHGRNTSGLYSQLGLNSRAPARGNDRWQPSQQHSISLTGMHPQK